MEEEIKDQALNLKSWNYLVMACQDSAFTVLTTATMSNAYKGWTALLDKYHKNGINSLVDIKSDFTKYKLKSENEDPSLWIGRLKIINERLAKIDIQYKIMSTISSCTFLQICRKSCTWMSSR
jgi:hypothetical protein